MDQHEQHFQGSALVKDIVIGMSDGLTVPFALAAGLSGALADNQLVITAGLAEIAAGSIAMGLGGYLAGRTETEHYHAEERREFQEVETIPEREKAEVREVLEEYGVSTALSGQVAEELSRDKKKWVAFMMRFELGLEPPDPRRAGKSAWNIALSYVAGGLVPLSAYFFTTSPHLGLRWSCAITLAALAFFGWAKARAMGQPPLRGMLTTTLIGALASAAAFGIAKWIAH